ncbi:Membrane protein involved in the export of O-antigen and teichoic acid [Flavobacterium fluvii]|uniref:Membrane protein involved in the export of O-antigen and teichoic acid n=1 Tax=Flavobacterium fluvii TaxID=468056 RepID=A0A1M5IK40_9FLAO|nr:polysaccharide biosynthesis C-terminal domain-containing protein [Flavobacterium fluvii]SHG28724.1 Membrane protein involved in the export of O-antigen and teichoic acid [Flavobacterium fluvii]
MRSRKKTTKINLFFQYYAFIYSIILGIFLVPLYLKYISLEIYGGWLATGNIVAWLTVIDPGISDVLRQQAGKAYGADEKQKLNGLLGSGTLLSLIVSILVLIIGLVLTNYIVDLISIRDINSIIVLKNAFVLAVVGTSLMIFSYGFISFNQGILSSMGVGVIFVVGTVISLIVNITLLMYGYGVYSIPIAQIFFALILIFGNIAYIFWRYIDESLKFRFSISGFLDLTKLTGYNVFGRLGSVMSTQIDTLLVARYLGAEIAPILSFTKKGPELSRMFIDRNVIAMQPAVTNAWESGEYDKVRINTSRLYFIIIWVLGLIFTNFIIFNKYFVSLWVGKNLFAGNTVNVIISINIILAVLVNMSSNILFALGKIKQTSKINFVQSILTVITLFIGVKYFGLYGLVLAQVLSTLVFSAWYFPYKTFKIINYNKDTLIKLVKEIVIVFSITIGCIIVAAKLGALTNWIVFFTYVIVVVLIYLLLLSILSKAFRREISGILKKYIKLRQTHGI